MYNSALDTTSPWRAEDTAGNISLQGLFLLSLSLFVVSFASIKFSSNTNSIETLWPSNAILFAVLLRAVRNSGNRARILLSGGIAFVLASLSAGDSLPVSAAQATANIAEIATATWLLGRILQANPDITRLQSLVPFIVLAAGIAPIVSATMGTAAVSTANSVPFFQIWQTWYAANALGMIIVAPFALIINSAQWHALQIDKRFAEAISLLVLISAVAWLVFFYSAPLLLIAPAVILATFRFGAVGAAVGIFAIAFVGTLNITFGLGPSFFRQVDIPGRILNLQILLAVTALWALPVAAVLLERNRLAVDLAAGKSAAEAAAETKSRMVKKLQRLLWDAEERERLRLAQELHDQTGQALVVAMMELSGLEPHVNEDGRKKLQCVREQLDQVGETLRHVAWELRPSSLDDFGLAQALANHTTCWRGRQGIEVDLQCSDPDLDGLPDDVRTTIYRVVQESLTNVAKHAKGATSVSIILDRQANILRLMIEDDGSGFNPESDEMPKMARPAGGCGLIGMRERLSYIDGDLNIVSSVGAGTTIFVRIRLDA